MKLCLTAACADFNSYHFFGWDMGGGGGYGLEGELLRKATLNIYLSPLTVDFVYSIIKSSS